LQAWIEVELPKALRAQIAAALTNFSSCSVKRSMMERLTEQELKRLEQQKVSTV
jgi:hypothetical protein